MKIVSTKAELKAILDQVKARGQSIGLVPTMGALHPGHMSLVQAASAQSDFVIVTIFVNPLQFGQGEDLDKYPRRLEADALLCESHGAHLVFAPSPEEMYERPTQTLIANTDLDDLYCGAYRPGHFKGVLTVVAKLFNLSRADKAFFGSKDYQQLYLIQRMVKDLDMCVEVIACPTVREQDGLAMSSRNEYLSPELRQKALGISQGLQAAQLAFEAGERSCARLQECVRGPILASGADSIQYIEVLSADDLLPRQNLESKGVILVAAYYGNTRLIDNRELI